VRLGVTPSRLAVVAVKAELVYVPPLSVTLMLGAVLPIVNVAIAEPLV
jgi:hypothetical protein